MSEPVFHRHARGLTLAEIVALTGAAAPPTALLARRIAGVAPLDLASPGDLTFFDNKNYADAAGATHAGACFTSPALAKHLPAHVPVLLTVLPYRAFIMVMREMFPHALRPFSLAELGSVSGVPVHPTARLEDGVTVEPGAVIGPRAAIGSGTVIGATAVIGAEVQIGRECSVGAGAIVTNSLIGDRVIIHPGCKIGQDGFGFLMTEKGFLKIPQIGRVIVQDDVEIGAGTTIDRGAMSDTILGEGTKIDNLVQIGHNVVIGRYCILIAQTGVSGSVTIGDYVMLGGQVGITDHVKIGDGAKVAAQSGVISDVPAGQRWGGYPARPRGDWLRAQAAMFKLARRGPAGKSDPATKDREPE